VGRAVAPTVLLALSLLALLAGCSGGEETQTGRETTGRQEERTGEPEATVAGPTLPANEAGLIMVLQYHRVGGDPDFAPEWTISPEDFRGQLRHLRDNGYYPVNFRNLVEDGMDVPAGKTPVVLTFDDSSDTQFTMIRKGGGWVPDPEGAVGILTDFNEQNPGWPTRATFFVLPEADAPNNLFGQPELARKKLRYLVERGMEVGSHTLYHENLALAPPEEVQRQLALSIVEIRKHLPDYEVATMSVPFGEYPQDISLLKSGTYDGHSYSLEGAAEVTGGATYPPGHPEFDPYRVPRIQAEPEKGDVGFFFDYFEENPGERFVSDGDPDKRTVPDGAMGGETTGAAHEQY
jgi:peptidoglycan/xylan/chitin deacetylase (PgdA/CDA1 family)